MSSFLPRRAFLSDFGLGFAGVALQSMLQREAGAVTCLSFRMGSRTSSPGPKA